MANVVHTSYHNRVRYTLRNSILGNKYISEPIGWNEDEKELKRSTKVHGVFTSLSNNLKFYKGDEDNDGGYDYILSVYRQQGINATILLIKDEKNPLTDEWEEAYRGYLHFPSPMSWENNQISIKFKESSFYHALQSRENEKLELERLETMDGATIEAITTSTVAQLGRDIFLVSQLELDTSQATPFTISHPTPYRATALPQSIKSKSDESIQGISITNMVASGTSYGTGTTENMFYAESDSIKTLELTFDIDYTWTSTALNYCKLELVRFNNGVSYDFVEVIETLAESFSYSANEIIYSGTVSVELQVGESLALANHSTSVQFLSVTFNTLDTTIKEESSNDEAPKSAKFILPHEALERIIQITTGEEEALVSNILGRTDVYDANGNGRYTTDGNGAFSGLIHGLWIRGFDALPLGDENKYKPITTSFNDFVESFGAVWNTGYGIERTGLSEKIRFEERQYFYQEVVTIPLPNQASNIKRTVAKDYFYSSTELGYKKPSGEQLYEEAMGLDEYNIKNTATTAIKILKNEYKSVSEYRADSYGMEFARRKGIDIAPTEDTRYDNDIFVMDLKRGWDVPNTDVVPDEGIGYVQQYYEQRLWADDFAVAPTGVYSPETAQNLRFSPVNMMLRHGWWIRSGLNVYKDSYIRFASSTGNSNLTTQLTGGTAYSERGYDENALHNGKIIQVRDLESPFFEPEIVEFQHEVTTAILQNVYAKTLINGNKVMNYYGLVEFINEDGKYEYGYLLELKPNKDGKWKLLKSTKKPARKSIIPDPPLPDTDLQGFDYDLNFEIDG